MEELMSIATAIGTVIAVVVGLVAGVVVAYAGFLYATAMGDAQKTSTAKNAFAGAFIGMLIASMSFAGPRILTNYVIKPAGGIAVETEVGLNCDGILRNQLVFQRGASTADRMNVVISQIQSQHSDCASDVWQPEVIDMVTTGTAAGKCFSATAGTQGDADSKVGDSEIPPGLMTGGATPKVRARSGRDSENNILVYFSDAESRRPSDGASCWLFFARLKGWHENYW